MGIFKVPVAIAASLTAAAAYLTLRRIRSANSRKKIAQDRYTQHRKDYDIFVTKFEQEHSSSAEKFDEFMKIRLEALVTLGDAVKFLERAKLKERNFNDEVTIPEECLIEWKNASINAIDLLGGMLTSAGSGVITALSTYSLVGLLASASTGTAISTLSGAAATNATLAWLGGGALTAGGAGVAVGTVVLGGLVITPTIMVYGFVATWQASKFETEVENYVSEIDVDQANKEKIISELNAVKQRVDELRQSTIAVNTELIKLLSNSNQSDEQETYLIAKTAKTLGDILDIPILDQNGYLIKGTEV